MDLALPAAALCLVLCGALGWFVPQLVARVPEPVPEPVPDPQEPVESEREEQPEDRALFSASLPPAPPKELYADIARARGLAPSSALGCALVGAAFGGVLGFTGALVFLVPLVPVGAALLVIDWRTTLLPTWIIARTYAALLGLLLVAAALDRDPHALLTAAGGWLVVGGWFFGLWFVTRGGGWGYGDVRLSGVLGLSLGYLGWSETLSGLFLILLVGGLAGVVQVVATRSVRGRLPYGPMMLVGAALGVTVGPWLARGLGY